MRLSEVLMLAGTVGVAFFHGGCGEKESAKEDGNWLSCQLDEFRIEGELNGQPLSIVESTAGGGWTQTSRPEFRSQYGTMAQNPARTNLVLEWPEGIWEHQSSDAKGSLILPSGAPYNGASYGLGTGTRVHDGSDDTFQFILAGITDAQGTPVSGELRGCWRPDFNK